MSAPVSATVRLPVGASAATTFDYIGTNALQNHPTWEPEVLAVRRLDDAPVHVGTRAVMVRKAFPRPREVEYSVTEFEPGHRIAFDHPNSAMDFWLCFEVTPTSEQGCEVRVDVRAQPHGALRAMTPLMRRMFPRRTARITAQMVRVVEAHAAQASSA